MYCRSQAFDTFDNILLKISDFGLFALLCAFGKFGMMQGLNPNFDIFWRSLDHLQYNKVEPLSQAKKLEFK